MPAAKGESPVRAIVRTALASPAKLAGIPLQDWLEEGAAARINTPGTVEYNWCWRVGAGQCTPALARQIRDLSETYLRA